MESFLTAGMRGVVFYFDFRFQRMHDAFFSAKNPK